ncbi:MAG: ribonuclease HII [Erysipelotrichaceae bacterium]
MECENQYEKAWWDNGYKAIVGLDEAGRGPMAGPLVVAAVSFPKNYHHEEIYDSKKVSEKNRNRLFKEIIEQASEYHIEIVAPSTIDKENIYRATQHAMERLVKKFKQCDGVLSDAMPLPDCEYEVISLIKGDQKSVSIAAASILAKVVRDHIMCGYDVLYPEYGFAKHKGYPTKLHKEALIKYGVLSIHRKSYAPVANQLQYHFDV